MYSVASSTCELLPGVNSPTIRAHVANASVSTAGPSRLLLLLALPLPRPPRPPLPPLLAVFAGGGGSWSAARLRRSYKSYTLACIVTA